MRNLRPQNDLHELEREAGGIRQALSRLLDAPSPRHIVLAPGLLAALQILFAKLGVRRILLTEGEYYGAAHFPAQKVMRAGGDWLMDAARKFRLGAVIASVVSWRGAALPCPELFSEIRRLSPHSLLVADYCHAGAAGFPSVKRSGADVVCGGMGKWITPPGRESRLGFLWFRSRRLYAQAESAFLPFFLATERAPRFPVSRWLDPAEVRWLSAWLEKRGLTRAALVEQHRADSAFAARLAARFGLPTPPTNILWLDRAQARSPLAGALERRGLAWRLPDGRSRVLCRAPIRR